MSVPANHTFLNTTGKLALLTSTKIEARLDLGHDRIDPSGPFMVEFAEGFREGLVPLPEVVVVSGSQRH